MNTINSAILLKEAIVELEIKKKEQGQAVKEQFNAIKENLRPANIIRKTIDEVATSPKLRLSLMGALVGLGAAYFSRKLVIGKSASTFRNILGSVLQLGISAVVASKPGVLQSIGQNIAKRVFIKRNSYEPSSHQRN
jgi:hypothetical protein